MPSNLPQGPLLIGAMETTTALRIGDKLAEFAAKYPDVDLSLRTGTTAELVEQVLQQQLDGAFVCGPIAHTRLVSKPAFHENLVVIAGPDCSSLDTFVARGQAGILVLRRGCSYRHRLIQILARRGIAVARTMEYGSIDAIIACASAGMGITLFPIDLIESYKTKYWMSAIQLPEDEARVDTVFIRRNQAFVTPALAAFLNNVGAS
jgi:DNA-binding transcriptional LysR family regulator